MHNAKKWNCLSSQDEASTSNWGLGSNRCFVKAGSARHHPPGTGPAKIKARRLPSVLAVGWRGLEQKTRNHSITYSRKAFCLREIKQSCVCVCARACVCVQDIDQVWFNTKLKLDISFSLEALHNSKTNIISTMYASVYVHIMCTYTCIHLWLCHWVHPPNIRFFLHLTPPPHFSLWHLSLARWPQHSC